MKFCSKCGKQLDDAAVICPGCGCAVGNITVQAAPTQASAAVNNADEKATLANCALAFAFLLPIVGLILGIIGVVKYKTQQFKNRCIAAIPVSVVVQIVCIIISWDTLYYYF